MKKIMSFLVRFFNKSGTDRIIYLCIFILSIFGIYMVADASVGMAASKGSNYPITNMIKQTIFVCFGFFSMAFCAKKFRSKKLNRRIILFLYCGLIFLMGVCLFWTINSSHAWIVIGPISIQPSEFMKLTLILLCSYYCGTVARSYRVTRNMSKKAQNERYGELMKKCVAWPMLAVCIAFLLCAFLQKDLGSAIIMAGICLAIAFSIPNPIYKRLKYLALIGILVIFIAIPVIYNFVLGDHQKQRFASWLEPLNPNYVYGSSYQIVNGMIGYSNGGLVGRGPGNSVMKYGYIPEAQNDYISAIITEEFGLLGISIVILLYLIIIMRLMLYAFKVKNDTEKLILIGIASYFFFHMFVNLGGVSGLIPMTGVPLLLISAGGSSTFSALTAIGIAQSIIAKYNRKILQNKAEKSL